MTLQSFTREPRTIQKLRPVRSTPQQRIYEIGSCVLHRTGCAQEVDSYCVKDAAGRVYQEGKIGSSRRELDVWIRTMPQPRMIAMEATIFSGWIYDHLLPHAEKVKVAHPLMLRANRRGQEEERPHRCPARSLTAYAATSARVPRRSLLPLQEDEDDAAVRPA